MGVELHEVKRRANKELESAKRNLTVARDRNSPEQDILNLENKLAYRQAIVELLDNFNE
jgi:hypothetical protein